MTDNDLAVRARQGDTRAFELLVRRYYDLWANICYELLGQGADKEDALQDTLVKVWLGLASYDEGKGDFRSWSYSVARRAALDALHKRVSRVVREGGVLVGEGVSGGDSVVRRVLVYDDLSTIARVLREVRGISREGLLGRIDGREYREIAGRLGCSDRGLRVAVCKLRARLRKAVVS